MCVCAAAECVDHAESVALNVDSDESYSCLHSDLHHLLQESTWSVMSCHILSPAGQHILAIKSPQTVR